MADETTWEVMYAIAGGVCEKCRGPLAGWSGASRHHRQPRGMGGSRLNVHTPAHLLVLCGSGVTGCHGWVEGNRAEAYGRGLLVRRGFDPLAVPFLDDAGDLWLPTETTRLKVDLYPLDRSLLVSA